jgi:hypothetical protein
MSLREVNMGMDKQLIEKSVIFALQLGLNESTELQIIEEAYGYGDSIRQSSTRFHITGK